ncbi:DNA repair helicase and transcription factor protein [Leishmania donovani]|uniref:DNA 3'-5' helicase n=3 Tax=Leishmania donovani species complex TaxID=38574 RepID=A4I8L0_LEIIN|nr:putative DNA repair helicase [Leishmania infantum JPCM5]TPP47407.1 Type III restriction enzyme, res subunit family protein [Leishmania donovani]CAC9528751.1 DNA_repair_helicase_and_transcription_factor_protein_-_putative [Leishmania infantum]CAJ1991950.1 DNA repair helicase and transcription factor protein [Leishmania donovani]CAM71155.1 putative DNA repair helicase [Leishmania infantum JPCM5]SUZ44980.1 DNA_repair_helicase_and_transcription_factor_protein_-_putative [Leishmania infantum]|eukprot:XP_001468079.1 putative DNA repair helicase [Leishmania infantum JPCM5]
MAHSLSGDARAGEECLFVESRIESDGYITIIAESFRRSYVTIRPRLTTLAEAISRPSLMHEYRLTPFSLGAAVSNGIDAAEATAFLETYAYGLAESSERRQLVRQFIESCMMRYNLARIIIDAERTLVQCKNEETAQMLLRDAVIASVAVTPLRIFYEKSSWEESPAPYPSFLLQSRAMSKVVAAQCVVLGLPIQQQYDFENDTSVRTAHISLRTQTKPRRYQIEAVDAAIHDGTLNSGCLLLPCGAGKTLLGIMLMCKVKKPTLVVCAGSVSVEQWKSQILDYATLEAPPPTDDGDAANAHSGRSHQIKNGAARIACLTGKQKDPITEETDVVLTTYSMLVTAHKAKMRQQATTTSSEDGLFTERGLRKRKENPKEKLFAPYGLLILDEVHVMPAESFRGSLGFVDAKGVIGLTATYVREDHKILDLFHLVGPKLYDISMETLASQGYLAKVHCVEVRTPMTKEFGLEYMHRSSKTARARTAPVLVMLAAANPNKMMCVRELVRQHLDAGAKILLCCDHITLLKEYGELLNAPVICGTTQHKERLMIFSDFQSTSKINVICVSRVGDVSVNLPNANVVIQVSSHGGSRRQEAQRLGRILRPKERAANGRTVDAWFYSIISIDTVEMNYAAHRTAFLVDQGYTCRVMEYNPFTSSVDTALGGVKQQVKKHRIGDVVSIKQESLYETLHHSSVLQPRSGERSGRGADAGDCRTESLSYQLELLSKVVSSWEIEFQQECRKRRRTAVRDADDNAANETESADDVVEARPIRTYAAIKSEWRSGADSAARVTALRDLVGVDDGFVYHEL